MAPPFSSSDYVTNSSGEDLKINSIDNTHIINGTITGADIATGTITNVNFVDGTITPEKLSSALVAKLEDFNLRLEALENAGGGGAGWSGNLVFTRTEGAGSNIVIYLKTDAGFIANAATYPANNTFAVSLPTPESYLYVKVQSGGGGWEVGTQNFRQNVGEPTYVFENNVLWYRYVLGGYDLDTLNYDFTTYYDD
jgi:hypothetical protein